MELSPKKSYPSFQQVCSTEKIDESQMVLSRKIYHYFSNGYSSRINVETDTFPQFWEEYVIQPVGEVLILYVPFALLRSQFRISI